MILLIFLPCCQFYSLYEHIYWFLRPFSCAKFPKVKLWQRKKSTFSMSAKRYFFEFFFEPCILWSRKQGFFVVSTFLVPTKTTFCKLFGHYNLNALILKLGNWRNLVKELSPQIVNLNEDSFCSSNFLLIFWRKENRRKVFFIDFLMFYFYKFLEIFWDFLDFGNFIN